MKQQLDLTKEYGIVLEGGGARGSYQVGAWKALREAGVRIKGIAGASVGALNGALMCMDDLEKAEYIWDNISYSKVMDVDEDLMECMQRRDYRKLDITALLEDGKRLLKDRGFDITPLKKLITETVDEERIRSSSRELFVSTICLSDRKPLTVNVKEVPQGEIPDILLASAYFPAFKLEKLGGKLYTDGGMANNVPVNVLAERGYENLIVMRIYGLGLDTERFYQLPEQVHVFHIAPRQSLGGILEFDRKRAGKNMALGYLDAKRMMYGLAGVRYYIDAPQSEDYYFEKLLAEAKNLKSFRQEMEDSEMAAHYPGAGIEEALETAIPERKLTGCREYTEELFPWFAKHLKLKADWDYKELYLAVLEALALFYRLPRFRIYTADSLLSAIHQSMRTAAGNGVNSDCETGGRS